MDDQIYLIGDTIWLDLYFRDPTGILMEVTVPIVKFYQTVSNAYVQIGTDIDLTAKRVVAGHYQIRYTIPEGAGSILCEYSGLDTQNEPTLDRFDIQRAYKRSVGGTSYL